MNCVALTFDDRPNPIDTPKLLDLLREKGVKATFFVVGQRVDQYPELVLRAWAEGHLSAMTILQATKDLRKVSLWLGHSPISFTVTVSPSVPTATITSLSSTSAAVGSSAMTLTINGSGFVASSTVTYKGVGHAATFVSASQLSMTLSTSDLATAGTFPIVVTDPGGSSSNSVNFTVTSGGGGGAVLPNKTFTFMGTMALNGKSLPWQIITYANGDGTYSLFLTAGTQGAGLLVSSTFNSGVTSSGTNAVFSGTCDASSCIYMNQDTGAYTNIMSVNLSMKLTSFAQNSPATGTVTFSPGSVPQGTFSGTFTSISDY